MDGWVISKLAVGLADGTGLHKHPSPGTRACFNRSPCSRSCLCVILSRFVLPLRHPSMTLSPNDVFIVSPSTALEMAEGLMVTLNTIIKHLPEPELRRMRDTLEIALYTADNLLLNVILSSDLDTLTISGGVYDHFQLLLCSFSLRQHPPPPAAFLPLQVLTPLRPP